MKMKTMLLLLLPILAQGQLFRRNEPQLFSAKQCITGDCENGVGIAQSNEGHLYYGRWHDNKPHGQGSVFFSLDQGKYEPGTFFVARFIEGAIQGMATFEYPGEVKKTVKFRNAYDFDNYTDMGNLHPRSRRFVVDDEELWDGWKIRQESFLKAAPADRLTASVFKNYSNGLSYTIAGTCGEHKVYFLVDTGCSITSLSASTISYLRGQGIGFRDLGSMEVQGGAGTEHAALYELETLVIAGIEFRNVVVSEMKNNDVNLLGFDVLNAFGTLELDMVRGELKLY